METPKFRVDELVSVAESSLSHRRSWGLSGLALPGYVNWRNWADLVDHRNHQTSYLYMFSVGICGTHTSIAIKFMGLKPKQGGSRANISVLHSGDACFESWLWLKSLHVFPRLSRQIPGWISQSSHDEPLTRSLRFIIHSHPHTRCYDASEWELQTESGIPPKCLVTCGREVHNRWVV